MTDGTVFGVIPGSRSNAATSSGNFILPFVKENLYRSERICRSYIQNFIRLVAAGILKMNERDKGGEYKKSNFLSADPGLRLFTP